MVRMFISLVRERAMKWGVAAGMTVSAVAPAIAQAPPGADAQPPPAAADAAAAVLSQAYALDEQVQQLLLENRAAEALPLAQRSLDLFRQAYGDQPHADIAWSLNVVGDCLERLYRTEEALPYRRQALEMRLRLYPRGHAAVVESFNATGLSLHRLRRPAEALEQFQSALAMCHRLYGAHADHRDTATSLNNVAAALSALGRAYEALDYYRSALAMRQRLYANLDGHADLVQSLGNLGYCLNHLLGQPQQALPYYQQALEMSRRLRGGRDHPETDLCLNNLATCLKALGRESEALVMYEQMLAMRRRLLGQQDHYLLGRALNNLADCLRALGRVEEALQKHEEALAMRRRLAGGHDHPEVAQSLSNAAYSMQDLGRLDEALDYFNEALAMYQRIYRDTPNHRDIATSLHNVASCLQALGRLEEARDHYRAALEMRRQLAHGDDRLLAASLNRLGLCLSQMGDLDEALRLFEESLAMRRRLYREDHPELALSLTNIALLMGRQGQIPETIDRLLRASRVEWAYLTRSFPLMSNQQKRQFLAHADFQQCEILWSVVFRQGAAAEQGLRGALLSKQLLTEVARQEQGAMYSVSADSPEQWQQQWQQRQSLRQRYATLAMGAFAPPASGAAADEATAEEQLQALAEQIESLEQDLRRANPAYAAQARIAQIELEDVAAALRPGEALIEFVTYRPYDFTTGQRSAPRYGAFVLMGGSGVVACVDLGEAAAIDQAVVAYRQTVVDYLETWKANLSMTPKASVRRQQHRQDRDNPGVLTELRAGLASAALRQKAWDPLARYLQDVRRVYIAPDGLLSLVPFEALATEQDDGRWRYLVEDREVVYLNTARDLARLAMTVRTRPNDQTRTAVLLANPAFSAEPREVAAIIAGISGKKDDPDRSAVGGDGAGAGTLGTMIWGHERRRHVPRNWGQADALYGLVRTAADTLHQVGWQVTTLTDAQATEYAALHVAAPTILQFATHGYVLDPPDADAEWENPLFRSMLILAGINRWRPEQSVFYHIGNEIVTEAEARARGVGDEALERSRIELADGVLTAYEVSGLNLHGTELVNLTACETGLGEVTPEGVAGLRQAFLLAGARSLTMSMWEVPASETAEQVAGFYRRWLGGDQPMTRYRAFREAQLAALAHAREHLGGGHPFFWAGVVYIGDPGDLPATDVADANQGEKSSRGVNSPPVTATHP